MTPIADFRTQVQPDWIDHNGHMNVAYYVLVFDQALEALLDQLGLGQTYRDTENKTLFVVESHITYEREAGLGETLLVTSQVIGYDNKKISLFHEMHSADHGHLSATQEVLLVHIDQSIRRAAPLPNNRHQAIQAAHDRSMTAGYPEKAGRQLKPLVNRF